VPNTQSFTGRNASGDIPPGVSKLLNMFIKHSVKNYSRWFMSMGFWSKLLPVIASQHLFRKGKNRNDVIHLLE